jgi:hypothetical protein
MYNAHRRFFPFTEHFCVDNARVIDGKIRYFEFIKWNFGMSKKCSYLKKTAKINANKMEMLPLFQNLYVVITMYNDSLKLQMLLTVHFIAILHMRL